MDEELEGLKKLSFRPDYWGQMNEYLKRPKGDVDKLAPLPGRVFTPNTMKDYEREYALSVPVGRQRLQKMNNAYYTKIRYAQETFPYQNRGDVFVMNDIRSNGKPGIRHGTVVSKDVLRNIASAAKLEGVPLIEALATGLRESGLGHEMNKGGGLDYAGRQVKYDPAYIYFLNSSQSIPGYPLSPSQWALKKNIVPEGGYKKEPYGYVVTDMPGDIKTFTDYMKYIDSFKRDPSLAKPFVKEMRFLKRNMGQAYNPGEKDRLQKMEEERNALLRDQQVLRYAQQFYK